MTSQYRCRLCLEMVPNTIDIFKDDFPKMIEILTSIRVSKTDNIPKQSCLKCARDVKAALLTRKRIIKSYKILCEELKCKQSETSFLGEFCKSRPNIQIPSIANKMKLRVKPIDNLIADETRKNIEFISIASDQNEANEKQDIHYEDSYVPEAENTIDIEHDSYVPEAENTIDIEHLEVKVEDTSIQNEVSIARSHASELLASETKNCLKVATARLKLVPGKGVLIRRRITKGDIQNNGSIIRRKKLKREVFSCVECKMQYSHRTNYNLHMAKHKKSKCDVCGKLIRSDNFKKHVAMHSSNPVVCDLCGVTCKNSDSLRGHHFYYHKCTASQYVCDQCGRGFRQRYKFFLHKKKEHGGDRSFKCDTCGKAFFTKVNLNNHVNMTHKKLRPHVCEYCGKAFSGKYALKTHVRQHTNEAPYSCEFCSEGFRQKVSLKAHLKSKHGLEEQSTVFCTNCNKGFATNYALKIHERLHLMKKCEHCSESFAEQTYLDNHVKQCHAEEQKAVVTLPIEQLKDNYLVHEQLMFDNQGDEKPFGNHADVIRLLEENVIE